MSRTATTKRTSEASAAAVAKKVRAPPRCKDCNTKLSKGELLDTVGKCFECAPRCQWSKIVTQTGCSCEKDGIALVECDRCGMSACGECSGDDWDGCSQCFKWYCRLSTCADAKQNTAKCISRCEDCEETYCEECVCPCSDHE